jgi:hypothetical protein
MKRYKDTEYFVNEDGEVFRKWSYGYKKLKSYVDDDGYNRISLFINKKVIAKRIHRIVAEVYLPNQLNLPEVNHKDTNKMNNNISNLEWITHQQNIEHAFHNNLYVKGSKKWNSKLTEEDVLWVRKNHIPKHFQFSAKSLSIKFNVSAATIHKIIHNKTWT